MSGREAGDPRGFLPLHHLWYHVLLVLSGTRLHGYGIVKEISRRTGGRLEPETGTLYTAIRRLREEGLIAEAEAAEATAGRRGRSYELTPLGAEVLTAESQRLAELVEIARDKEVLDAPAGGERGP